MEKDLHQLSKTISELKLTLWNDLPKFSIYSDQLIQIVNDNLAFMQVGDEKLITKSMVNNYVKWGMIPKPLKKKYDRIHISCLIVITILKQILPITKIKDGIQLQVILHGDEQAYNSFCEVFEESMRRVFIPILEEQYPYIHKERIIEKDKLAISAITEALANKLLTEKIIESNSIEILKREK